MSKFRDNLQKFRSRPKRSASIKVKVSAIKLRFTIYCHQSHHTTRSRYFESHLKIKPQKLRSKTKNREYVSLVKKKTKMIKYLCITYMYTLLSYA